MDFAPQLQYSVRENTGYDDRLPGRRTHRTGTDVYITPSDAETTVIAYLVAFRA